MRPRRSIPRILQWVLLALVVRNSLAETSVSPGESTESNPTKGSLDVVVLTTTNFEKNIWDGSVWLVEFYAPWYVVGSIIWMCESFICSVTAGSRYEYVSSGFLACSYTLYILHLAGVLIAWVLRQPIRKSRSTFIPFPSLMFASEKSIRLSKKR